MGLEMLQEVPLREHLKSCSINIDALRAELEAAVSTAATCPGEEEPDTQPTPDFQRVIQTAILNVQSAGGREVTVMDLFVAALKQKETLFASALWQRAMTANSAEDLPKITARACSLCGALTAVSALTAIAGRGVLCAACIDDVQALKRGK
jgi:ATP-dependent Clp protease ATP-binding subunit ClpA